MAKSLNQCNFIGRLGDDVESRHTQGGKHVANFNIAVADDYKDNKHTEWVRIVAWEKLADICRDYLKKGSHVFISGKFVTRQWEDNSGNTRYSSEIVANQMQMLDPRSGAGEAVGNPGAGQGAAQPSPGAPPNNFDNFDPDETIPF